MRPCRSRLQRGAHREQAVGRIARDDVRAARAVGEQQASPIGVATLDLIGVRGMVGDDRRRAVLLPPAKRRHVVLLPCSSPAWQAPVCEDQSVSQRDSRCEPPRSQRAIVGALPSRIARISTSCARPSISRKAGPASPGRWPPAPCAGRSGAPRCDTRTLRRRSRSTYEATMFTSVIATRHDHAGEERGTSRPGSTSETSSTIAPFSKQHAEAQREHRQRQREPEHERPHERVDQADQRGCPERRGDARDAHAVKQRAQQDAASRRRAARRRARAAIARAGLLLAASPPAPLSHRHPPAASSAGPRRAPVWCARPGAAPAPAPRGRAATSASNSRAWRSGSGGGGPEAERERAPMDRHGHTRGDPRGGGRGALGIEVTGPEALAPSPRPAGRARSIEPASAASPSKRSVSPAK